MRLEYVEPSLRGAVARVAVDKDFLGLERLALCDWDALAKDLLADHGLLWMRRSEVLRLICDLLLEDLGAARGSDETKESR